MVDICPKCGMPLDICVCQDIARESQKIRISLETQRFRKKTTVINGFDEDIDIKELAKTLKQKLACGGSAKDDRIILQGDQRKRVKDTLIKMNYNENQIDLC